MSRIKLPNTWSGSGEKSSEPQAKWLGIGSPLQDHYLRVKMKKYQGKEGNLPPKENNILKHLPVATWIHRVTEDGSKFFDPDTSFMPSLQQF